MLEQQLTEKMKRLKDDELLEAMKMHFRVYCKARIEARKRKLLKFANKKQFDDYTIVSTMMKSYSFHHCAKQLNQNLSGAVLERYKRLKQRHNILFISEKLSVEDKGAQKVLKIIENGNTRIYTANSYKELIKLAGIVEPNEIEYIMDEKNKKTTGNKTKIAALATPKKGVQKIAEPVKKASAPVTKSAAKPTAKKATPAKAKTTAKPAAKKAAPAKAKTAAKPAAKKAAPAKAKTAAKPVAKKAAPAKAKTAAKPAVKKAAPAKAKSVAKPVAKKATPAKAKSVTKPAVKKAAPKKK